MITFGNFRSIDEIMLFNAQQGQHYFDHATMRAFGSRVGQTLYGGCVFTESIHNWDRSSRVYRVKIAMSDGSIMTLADNCISTASANRIAKRWAESIESGSTIYDPQKGEFIANE